MCLGCSYSGGKNSLYIFRDSVSTDNKMEEQNQQGDMNNIIKLRGERSVFLFLYLLTGIWGETGKRSYCIGIQGMFVRCGVVRCSALWELC